MNAHPEDSVIEGFVIGAFEGDDDFLDHVSRCDECAAKLQREAAHELTFMDMAADLDVRADAEVEPRIDEVAPAVPSVPPPAPRRSNLRYLAPAAVVLAAAAAVALWVRRDRAHPVATAHGVVTCPDGSEQLACIADAQRAGRQIEYPSLKNVVSNGHGLTAEIEFESIPTLEGFDAVLAPLRQPIVDCIGTALNVQRTAEIHGAFAIHTKIAQDGHVESAGTVHQVRNRKKLPRELAGLSACVEATWNNAHFAAQQEAVKVVTQVHYVWRE